LPTKIYALYSSQYTPTNKIEQALSQENKALLYVTCGYSNLISKNYQDAIEDYQKASSLLLNSDDSGMDFLISFGTIVACDHLHLSQPAQRHTANIRNLISKNFQGREDSQELIFQNDHQVVESLTALAHTSTSEATKHLLMSFISEIFPSEPVSLSSTSFKQVNLCALHSANPYEAQAGFSFWKKAEKLARRIARTWDKIYSIYKQMREVKDDLKSRFKKEEKQ